VSHDPDDTQSYSLGVILAKMMKVADRGDIVAAVEEQSRMTEEEVLGQILVARGVIDSQQLEVALQAQRGLRSKNKHERAMAMAKLSEVSGGKIIEFAEVVRKESAACKRSQTGEAHPAITPEMLAGGDK
jgi:hypothetical protein